MTAGKNKHDTFPCPFCGEPVAETSLACPHCGSDNNTGWSDKTYLDNVDFGSDESYDEILEKEFGEGRKSQKISWKVITTVVLLIVCAIIAAVTLLR